MYMQVAQKSKLKPWSQLLQYLNWGGQGTQSPWEGQWNTLAFEKVAGKNQ